MINGDLLRKLRMSKTPYLTQSRLAKNLGMIQAQIEQLENYKNKKPNICTVYRLARFFNVTVDDLLLKDNDCC